MDGARARDRKDHTGQPFGNQRAVGRHALRRHAPGSIRPIGSSRVSPLVRPEKASGAAPIGCGLVAAARSAALAAARTALLTAEGRLLVLGRRHLLLLLRLLLRLLLDDALLLSRLRDEEVR